MHRKIKQRNPTTPFLSIMIIFIFMGIMAWVCTPNSSDKLYLFSAISLYPQARKELLSAEIDTDLGTDANMTDSHALDADVYYNDPMGHGAEAAEHADEALAGIIAGGEAINNEEGLVAQEGNQLPFGRAAVNNSQYASGTSKDIRYGNGYLRNYSSESNESVFTYASTEPEYNILKNGLPQVLIYHTHTTESYLLEDSGSYDTSYTGRSNNPEENMVRIGQEIVDQLNAAGIVAVHDTQIHDFSYNGSYNRSRQSVQEYLDQYPSIEIALDIHRDAVTHDDRSIEKATVMVDGKAAAQVMIIVGYSDVPNWPVNLRLAARLQDRMETLFPGLTRPLMIRESFYNQDLTDGSLLIEIGMHGNTLEEAIYSGQLVGEAITSYLEEIAN